MEQVSPLLDGPPFLARRQAGSTHRKQPALPAAPLPADETERLAALAALRIMDIAPDARFDVFVRLAADLYDVPIALVTLVDEDRQWFKAAHGLDVRQTPRDMAFCAHAILSPSEVMVVEDATADERFAANALVVGVPGIRFYAGAVIRAPSGEALGTLCVIDRKPRTLDEAGRRRLAGLAEGVSALVALHRATADLRHSASHDALTGLANRALFDHRLDLAVRDALTGRPCAVLTIDLDRFRQINDTLGIPAGDTLLREVAARLSRTVGSEDLVARLGCDEFAILLAEPADSGSAGVLVSRLQSALADPVLLEGHEISFQASVGVALCPLDATSPGALMRIAGQALTLMKRDSEARATQAAPGAERLPARTFSHTGRAMDADLRLAIGRDADPNGALRLHWQPIFGAHSGALCGYEALQRWNRPGHGNIPPGIFIPFAEASGLIGDMDSWAVRTACMEAATWPSDIGVSVNLSAHWFGGADVEALVATAIGRAGIAPHRLCLEITERTVIARRDVARAQIDALHRLGVRVAMDDFGTGFSSLAYLRDLPFDVIKLDRSFVSVLGDSGRANAVACGIIDLGHRLGMTVCAEGVETTTQLALLRQEGCDTVQGYLLGRPAPDPSGIAFAPVGLFKKSVGPSAHRLA